MKAGLESQDFEGAVSHLNSANQNRYRDIFTELGSELSTIAQNMQDIQLIYVRGKTAKYRIRKNEIYGGQNMTITYYIYFVKDENGRWSIDSF